MVFLSGHEYNRTQSADCFQNGIQKIAVEPSLIFVTVIICWNIELVFEGLDIGLGIELNTGFLKSGFAGSIVGIDQVKAVTAGSNCLLLQDLLSCGLKFIPCVGIDSNGGAHPHVVDVGEVLDVVIGGIGNQMVGCIVLTFSRAVGKSKSELRKSESNWC